MTESVLYQKYLKSEFEREKLFFHRIEAAQIPDLFLCKNGNALWAELKCVNDQVSGNTWPRWRPGQLAWIRKSFLLGGNNVCLILWYREKVYWLPPKEYYKEEELVCQKEIYLQRLNKVQIL